MQSGLLNMHIDVYACAYMHVHTYAKYASDHAHACVCTYMHAAHMHAKWASQHVNACVCMYMHTRVNACKVGF